MYKSFLYIIVLLATCLIAGCKSNPKPEEVLDKPDDYEVVVHQGQKAEFFEPVTFEQNLGLHARSEGNVLIVSARNRGQEEMYVSPQNLALITGPDPREDLLLIHPGTADLSQVTPLILNPGEPGILTIPMKVPVALKGARLVYNNKPQGILFYVDVQ